nr:helix-turn-helix transcriptional regulator [Amylibacter sp. SFDW26]
MQLRMARAAIEMGTRELASLAEVSPATISRFEKGKGGLQSATSDRIQSVLEGRGVIFLNDGAVSVGAGVSMKTKDESVIESE